MRLSLFAFGVSLFSVQSYVPRSARQLLPFAGKKITTTTTNHIGLPRSFVVSIQSSPNDNDDSTNNFDDGDTIFDGDGYEEMEFVDYSDPNYKVDFGGEDEFYPSLNQKESLTDEEAAVKIEEMREQRRKRNDEYQFETYFAKVLQKGSSEFKGDWTVYSVVRDAGTGGDGGGPPKLAPDSEHQVTSRGKKIKVETDSEWRVDSERIVHEEFPKGNDNDNHIGINLGTYWPEKMSSFDFRGEQGNMVVGNAYTICDADPVREENNVDEGPFSAMRTEIGIVSDGMRFRVKFDYRIDGDTTIGNDLAPLSLHQLTVCRETLDAWPLDAQASSPATSQALFGTEGASGGLYDPPPVGGEDQRSQYLFVNLKGKASILFPHTIDQGGSEAKGWVFSLDWTPGKWRYQVDRKVRGGTKVKCLRTLELSEVRESDAEEYRPRDGGQDMRQ